MKLSKFPTFKPLVVKRKSELPKGIEAIATNKAQQTIPTHFTDNQLGISYFSHAPECWPKIDPTWTKEPPQEDEVSLFCSLDIKNQRLELNNEHSYAKTTTVAIFPKSKYPLRFSGWKYNKFNESLTPLLAIFKKEDCYCVRLHPEKNGNITTLIKKLPFPPDDPRIHICRVTEQAVSLNVTGELTIKEWEAFGFCPAPLYTNPSLPWDQVVQIKPAPTLFTQLIPKHLLGKVKATEFSNGFYTNPETIKNLSEKLRDQFLHPYNNADKVDTYRYRSLYRVQIEAKLPLPNDLHVKTLIWQGDKVIFNLEDIKTWPTIPFSCKYQENTAMLSGFPYNNAEWQRADPKKNKDATVWIAETPSGHSKNGVIPKAYGESRKEILKSIKDALGTDFEEKFPELMAPDLSDPARVSAYISAAQVIKSGNYFNATYIGCPFFQALCKVCPAEPWHQFNIFTKAEIEIALHNPKVLKDLPSTAKLALIAHGGLDSQTKADLKASFALTYETNWMQKIL